MPQGSFRGFYGAIAGADALSNILAARKEAELKAIADEEKRRQQEFLNSIQSGNLDVTRGRLGLDTRKVDIEEQQYGEARPKRDADLAGTLATTAGKEQETAFNRQDREWVEQNLANLPQSAGAGRVSPSTLAGFKFFGGLDLTTPSAQSALYSPEQRGREEGAASLAEAQGGGAQALRISEGIKADEQIRVARARLNTGTLEGYTDVAQMVTENPDLLTSFNATERGRILKHIASDPNQMFQTRRQQSANTMVDEAITLAQELKQDPDKGWAVGFQGPQTFFGFSEQGISGTKAAGFIQKFNTLKAKLVLPRVEFMRGMGQLSNLELQTLANSATSLSRQMPEDDFDKELDHLIATLHNTKTKIVGGGGGPRGAGGGTGAGEICRRMAAIQSETEAINGSTTPLSLIERATRRRP